MQVGISQEYFAKGLLDYENWKWAWGRELLQNGVDAGASIISFDIACVGDTTVAVCTNDAPPMSRDVLVDKFLNIGGSTKSGGDSVGGFGIAKTVIALAHKSYKIRTADMCVVGAGGSFDLETGLDHVHGTVTTVEMVGDVANALCEQIRLLCRYAQTPVTIRLNGEVIEANHVKGTRRRDLGFGVVYTSKRASNKLVVRISGIPMFTSYVGVDRLVTVELSGTSADVLTSNRDGLVSPYRGELSSFMTELAVDKRSALNSNEPRYMHFGGTRIRHDSKVRVNTASYMFGTDFSDGVDETVTLTYDAGKGEVVEVSRESREQAGSQGLVENPVLAQDRVPSTIESVSAGTTVRVDTEFVIKNETGLVIPDYYRPDMESFSAYSQKLIRIWGRLMLQVHRTMGHSDNFAVGFIFDDSTVAEHENGDFGRVYYISPAKVVVQAGSNSRSFKKRWKLTDRNGLLAVAVHEFIHGLGYSWHDECYANRFTTTIATVMDHRKDFNWCFK